MTEIKKLGHLMLDLETLGNKSNSAILSIGAVEFDLETGETGREFYQRIDLQSCIDKGLIINGSTFYWWITQNECFRFLPVHLFSS
jgi:DNA polymerase III epsilon subunit-like protein